MLEDYHVETREVDITLLALTQELKEAFPAARLGRPVLRLACLLFVDNPRNGRKVCRYVDAYLNQCVQLLYACIYITFDLIHCSIQFNSIRSNYLS